MTGVVTRIIDGFTYFMEPRSKRQDEYVRDYNELGKALVQSGKLDCVRNFFAGHVHSTVTLTVVLAREFFISGFSSAAELTDAVKELLSLNVYQALSCVGEALLDLIHMVKLAVYGPSMIIMCFFSPEKTITLFHTRVSEYLTPEELRTRLGSLEEQIRVLEEEQIKILEAEKAAYAEALRAADIELPRVVVELGEEA